jgi:hypothetical protein
MTAPLPSSSRRGALLLADISGYTGFLQGVSDAHRDLIVEADEPPAAYAVLSHLLDTMVGAVGPAFLLAKVEGDAIFAVADDGAIRGEAVLDCIRGCYAAFRERLGAAGSLWTCTCDACSRLGDLDLKFVMHHGTFVARSIAGQTELLGSDVNLVHRLLKNHARDVLGAVPYALITEHAVTALEIPTQGMVAGSESYDDTPDIPVRLLVLGAGAAA